MPRRFTYMIIILFSLPFFGCTDEDSPDVVPGVLALGDDGDGGYVGAYQFETNIFPVTVVATADDRRFELADAAGFVLLAFTARVDDSDRPMNAALDWSAIDDSDVAGHRGLFGGVIGATRVWSAEQATPPAGWLLPLVELSTALVPPDGIPPNEDHPPGTAAP